MPGFVYQNVKKCVNECAFLPVNYALTVREVFERAYLLAGMEQKFHIRDLSFRGKSVARQMH